MSLSPEPFAARLETFSLEKLPDRDMSIMLNEQIHSVVNLFAALGQIKYRDQTQRPSLDESQIPPTLFETISECGQKAGITEAMTEELMRQVIWGNFVFTNAVSHFIWVHKNSYESISEFVSTTTQNLSDHDKRLISKINAFNPIIGSSLAIFLGALDEKRHLSAFGYGNFHNLTHSLTEGYYRQTFERLTDDITVSLDALSNIDRVIKAFSCCNTSDSVASKKLLAAFGADLSRPVIEAIGLQLTQVFETVSFKTARSALYYAPLFPLHDYKSERHFLNEWRNHHNDSPMSQIFLRYLGINPESIDTRSFNTVPITAPIGSSDPGIFVRWINERFSGLANNLESPLSLSPRSIINNQLVINSNLKLLFNPQAVKNGPQARFNIIFGSGADEVSIRIDLEKNGLALDFGATKTPEMIRHVSALNKSLRPRFQRYEELQRTLGWRETLVKDENERIRLSLALDAVSREISFFVPEQPIDSQIPYFATLLNGFGQITGTRSPESISHHSREDVRRVGGEICELSEVFRKFVSDLRNGIKQTPLIPMKLNQKKV